MVEINRKSQNQWKSHNQMTFGLISNIFDPIRLFLIDFDFFQSKLNFSSEIGFVLIDFVTTSKNGASNSDQKLD